MTTVFEEELEVFLHRGRSRQHLFSTGASPQRTPSTCAARTPLLTYEYVYHCSKAEVWGRTFVVKGEDHCTVGALYAR
jgi:hypothetical protein